MVCRNGRREGQEEETEKKKWRNKCHENWHNLRKVERIKGKEVISFMLMTWGRKSGIREDYKIIATPSPTQQPPSQLGKCRS